MHNVTNVFKVGEICTGKADGLHWDIEIIKFPLDTPLPVMLITNIVEFGAKENLKNNFIRNSISKVRSAIITHN
jgi:hypothetical protein